MVGQQQFKGAEQEVGSAAVHYLVIRAVTEIHILTGMGQELCQIPARGACLRQFQVHGESAVDHVDFPADRQKAQTYGKIADNGLEKLAGIDVILVIGAGQLGNLHDAVHIGLGNLVGQAGGKMEILAKLIDRGDVDDAVADINDIGDMAGNQLGLSYGDGIVDGLVSLDASRIKGLKPVLHHSCLLQLFHDGDNGVIGVINDVDTLAGRYADDLVQTGMVEGPGTDNLHDLLWDGDRKFRLDQGAGEKDALVALDLLRALNLLQTNCIKGNIGSQYLVEITLEFKAYAGIDADNEHMVFWLASVHGPSS